MSEPEHIPARVERTEILEERGNRDAFHALLIVSALFALFLAAVIVAAWNTRIAFLPIAPRRENTFTPPAEQQEQKRILRSVEGAQRARLGVINFLRIKSPAGFGVTQVRLTTNSAARLGVGAPRNLSA
jgi:hypothetical protein